MIEERLAEVFDHGIDTGSVIVDMKAARIRRNEEVRQAVQTIINGCELGCAGCPIRLLCLKVFRSAEPWTWGPHENRKQR